MERIEFVREQIGLLESDKLLDLVKMIRYELGLRFGLLPAGPREKYDELCTLTTRWEEDRAEVKDAGPS